MFEYNIVKQQQNKHGFYCNKCGVFHSPTSVKLSYSVYGPQDTYLNGSQSCSKIFAEDKIEYLNLVGVRVNQFVMSGDNNNER